MPRDRNAARLSVNVRMKKHPMGSFSLILKNKEPLVVLAKKAHDLFRSFRSGQARSPICA